MQPTVGRSGPSSSVEMASLTLLEALDAAAAEDVTKIHN
jgi:hypothetical protein